MDEVWVDIAGFEGLYKISNIGRVMRLRKEIVRPIGNNYFTEEAIMSTYNLTGYRCIVLTKNKRTHRLRVHRLVAQAFIPNPENKPQVNHINAIRDDNRVQNLEWVDNRENAIHHSMNFLKTKSSRFPGVSYDKKRNKWLAATEVRRKAHFIGRFDIEEDAAEAYKNYILKLNNK